LAGCIAASHSGFRDLSRQGARVLVIWLAPDLEKNRFI